MALSILSPKSLLIDFKFRKPLQSILRTLVSMFEDCKFFHTSISTIQIKALKVLQVRITQAFETFMSTSFVSTFQEIPRLHSIRIASRTMRYALEVLPNKGDGLHLQALHEVQTLNKELGYIHDISVLISSLSLMSNQKVLTSHFKDLEKNLSMHTYEKWFSKKTNVSTITSFAESRINLLLANLSLDLLEHIPIHSNTDKSQAVLGVEIERRWLLSSLPLALHIWQISGSHTSDLPLGVRVLHMIQGYIPGEKITERLRSSSECKGVYGLSGHGCTAFEPFEPEEVLPTGQCECLHHLKRTIKSGTGLVRQESEESIDKPFFKAMWPLCVKRLHKIRFIIPVEIRNK
jgi:hypothetical protein